MLCLVASPEFFLQSVGFQDRTNQREIRPIFHVKHQYYLVLFYITEINAARAAFIQRAPAPDQRTPRCSVSTHYYSQSK